MIEKIAEPIAGIMRITTCSQKTHGKIGVAQQKRIKSI
jgi:hypothetical protein